MITLLIFWAFIAYGLTTIIVYGSIFDKPRTFITKHIPFIGDLITCILCTSTWVGFFLSLMLGGLSIQVWDITKFEGVFLDGMFTAGIVWSINSVVEFFEENRIK